jgi:hypothetical protein
VHGPGANRLDIVDWPAALASGLLTCLEDAPLKRCLCLRPPPEALRALPEDSVNARSALDLRDDRQGKCGERNNVLALIFRPAGRDAPNGAFRVDLRPGHRANFVAALPRKY